MVCKVSFICSILGLVMAFISFICYLTLCFPLCPKDKQGRDCPVSFYAKPEPRIPITNWKYHAPLHLCIMLILTTVIILFGVEVGCEKCRQNLAFGICLICLITVAASLGFALLLVQTDPYEFLWEFNLLTDAKKQKNGYFQQFNAAAGSGLAFILASLVLAIIVLAFYKKK